MPDHGIFEKVEIYGAVPGFIIRHTRPGSQIVKSHWHPELEINTAFEGSSRFFINGRVEDVTPQHIVLLTQCCQERDRAKDSTSQEPFRKLEGILTYIHDHYSEPLNTAQMAQQFFFSKEYFCRFFKKYTGATFSQYLAKYRVLQAEQLLAQTSKKISEIALETGFADEGSFIQCFRKYYGCTPRNYRKEITQNPFFRQD